MPQNALKSRTLNFNALNMAPYEGQFNVKDTGYKGRRYAGNVYSGLLPELMRAHFPEYIAFSPATVTTDMPTDPQHAGVFTPSKRTIALNPDGTNSMLMEPYGNYGYVGVGSNTTTEETLNALRTMLHESTHARTNLGPGQKRFGAHPAERLKSLMPRDRFEEMMTDIRLSGLPSVYEQTNPSDIIDEYFATATPARQMSEKNMSTRRIKSELKEVQRLADKYPELEKMRRDWERPELFAKD